MTARPTRPRLLVITRHLEALRGHYHRALLAIAERGVHLSIRYVQEKGISAEEYGGLLREAGVDFSLVPLPRMRRAPEETLPRHLRELGNALRFAHPDYTEEKMLEHAIARSAPEVQRWAHRILRLGPAWPVAASGLARLETALPPPGVASAVIEEESPDAVVAVRVTAEHVFVDYLKAARWRRIPTAIWVESWDNLTNKGLLHFVPDRVFVWNDRQAEELTRYHRIPKRSIRTTGAQNFDHWFNADAPTERAEFCSRFGLDQSRPIILYVGSSKQIAKIEPVFFRQWLRAIRGSDDPLLKEAAVFVRPHPLAVEDWVDRGFEQQPGVALSPSTIRDPFNSDGFRSEYRDELHHASLAVGINTTGMIDAAIFGKPVCTVELPELYRGQRGTRHFHHLVNGDRGLLHSAPTLEEHLAELSELVRRDPYERDERSDRFVQDFVRPRGLDVEPSQVLADEMVRLTGLKRSRMRRRPPVAGMLAGLVAWWAGRRQRWDAPEE